MTFFVEKFYHDCVIDELAGDVDSMKIEKLAKLLNIFWATDWILGAAQPPDGIRYLYYSRITPTRLGLCLNTIFSEECMRVQRLIEKFDHTDH